MTCDAQFFVIEDKSICFNWLRHALGGASILFRGDGNKGSYCDCPISDVAKATNDTCAMRDGFCAYARSSLHARRRMSYAALNGGAGRESLDAEAFPH